MADEVHQGDIGTVFEATVIDAGVAVDISAASTRQLFFKKPDGSIVTKTAVNSTTGLDGKMKYTTASSSDLDQIGQWMVQGHIAVGGGDWKSSWAGFWVHPNLA